MVKGASEGEGVNVQVLLRCRPLDAQERAAKCAQVVSCNDERREITVHHNVAGKQIGSTFKFDRVFGPRCTQAELYGQAIKPIVTEMLEGFNCTIFAYGQTGTGKTFTMTGGVRDGGEGGEELSSAAGVIPRAIQQIFQQLEAADGGEYTIKCSYLELYNEELIDLLAPDVPEKERTPVQVINDSRDSVVVKGQEEIIVRTAADIFGLLDRGNDKRRTASTLLNAQSSRSHSVFCVTAHMTERQPDGEDVIKIGKLYLVDLAGSESMARSGAVGARANEASCINKSLLVLGRVITALVEKSSHIPHRESKLTRLLKDSLGGHTKTCIIATIAPTQQCADETNNTLSYASRAKSIRNRPIVNQVISKAMHIKEMNSEINKLKGELMMTRQKDGGVFLSLETHQQMEKGLADGAARIAELEREAATAVEEAAVVAADQQRVLDRCRDDLAARTADFERSQAALAAAKQGLQERDFLLAAHERAGGRLQQQAQDLRAELGRTACELDTVFHKVEEKTGVEASNAACVQELRAYVSSQLEALHAVVAQATAQQQERYGRLAQLLAAHSAENGAATEALQGAAAALRCQLSSASTAAAAALEQCASEGGFLLQGLVDIHTEHLKKAATVAAAAEEALCSAHLRLKASMDSQSLQLNDFAARQQQETVEALTKTEVLLDAGCRSVAAASTTASQWADEASATAAVQQETLTAHEADVAASLASGQEALMAGIQAMLAKFAAEQQARTAAAMETARLQAASLQTSGAEHCQQLHRRAEEARTSLQAALARIQGAAEQQRVTREETMSFLQAALSAGCSAGTAMQEVGAQALEEQTAVHEAASRDVAAGALSGREALAVSAATATASCSAACDAIGKAQASAVANARSAMDATSRLVGATGEICAEARNIATGLLSSHSAATAELGGGVSSLLDSKHRDGVSTEDLPPRRRILLPSQNYIAGLCAPTAEKALAEFRASQGAIPAVQEGGDPNANGPTVVQAPESSPAAVDATENASPPTASKTATKRSKSGAAQSAMPLKRRDVNRQQPAEVAPIGKRRRTEIV